ncbi:TetR/AcrR family transcriptional regulator [Paenarthrobacter sp. AR 02]|uniref:TetR/AcrR family transcriptional regulator n=1 Tax=Paenarthrobacter sp. AR 02 TaxID=2899821 RepID=UPI001F38B35E|nr:TetR/AcrR family transcriptional regulator [Paenarthrobacter sp. AR 02]MCF3140843.1 TetR/AcrR family transcriptional regulator [Paenarthrobacter sp. AR 02]
MDRYQVATGTGTDFRQRWTEAHDQVRQQLSQPLTPGKEHLLTSALDACKGRSIANVSARDIARAAGLNPATLYSHYPGKAELLAAAFSWSYTLFLDFLLQNVRPEMEPPELLASLIRTHLEHDERFVESGRLWRDSPDLETSKEPFVVELRERVWFLPSLYRRLVAEILRGCGADDLVAEKAQISLRILNDANAWEGLGIEDKRKRCERLIRALLNA